MSIFGTGSCSYRLHFSYHVLWFLGELLVPHVPPVLSLPHRSCHSTDAPLCQSVAAVAAGVLTVVLLLLVLVFEEV